MRPIIFITMSLLFALGCGPSASDEARETPGVIAKQTNGRPLLDGRAEDACWKNATWYPIDQLWLGEKYTKEDFAGRFKVTWTNQAVYILAEIRDDQLIDIYDDGLERYWDDDCLEIFIDEDKSGGEHQFDYNAFAYHVAIDGKIADFGRDKKPHYFPENVLSVMRSNDDIHTWEVEMHIYDDTYRIGGYNRPVTLRAGKEMGFAIAYCDNDNSESRENFIGSVYVEGKDKNQGYKNADIFGGLKLVE